MEVTSAGVQQDDFIIPVIDFSMFLRRSSSTKSATAKSIFDAFKTSGFVYLTNHGIPSEKLSEVFRLSSKFFRRPQEHKESLSWTTPESNRGYSTFGREKVTQSYDMSEISNLRASNPDLKESMEIGKEGVSDRPNQWPDTKDPEDEAFTETMKSFFLICKDVHIDVMRSIALGMGLNEHFFDPHTDGGDNTLRLLHYPPVSKSVFKDNPDRVRAGEHTDYGSITLLFQDRVGGLEVRSSNGAFVPVKPIEGTVVVNAGDLLSRWSNDKIKSTRHRVVQPPAEDGDISDMYPARYSVAYFCNPNEESIIEALPGTWEKLPEGKKYPAVNSGEYLVRRLAATY